MKMNIVRVASVLPGIMMGLNGVSWLLQPAEAAKGLGMPLLDDIGRSTQIGDLGALFWGTAILIFVGAIRAQSQWIYSAALFLGLAATIRIYSAVVLGAGMATTFITVELVMTIWLVTCAYLMDWADTPK